MENPIKMDDLGGPPLFLETPRWSCSKNVDSTKNDSFPTLSRHVWWTNIILLKVEILHHLGFVNLVNNGIVLESDLVKGLLFVTFSGLKTWPPFGESKGHFEEAWTYKFNYKFIWSNLTNITWTFQKKKVPKWLCFLGCLFSTCFLGLNWQHLEGVDTDTLISFPQTQSSLPIIHFQVQTANC